MMARVGTRRAIISWTLLTAAVVLALLYFLRSGEPVYQGKLLTGWLEQFGTNHWSVAHGGDLDRQAEAALQHIGTNAVPIYFQMMTTRGSPIMLKLLTLLPKSWLARFHAPGLMEYRNQIYTRNSLGAYGFVALGEKAKPFVPALIALNSDEDRLHRRLAIFVLSRLGPTASEALPEFIKCLNDPDEPTRDIAATGLGEIHQVPEKSVPILMDFFEKFHKDAYHEMSSHEAIRSIGRFGAQAKPAIPMLIGLLNDPVSDIRDAATNALRCIDPDVAAKAGVQ
ncbi:MAG TPA: HEAT repeat domain-containing protein [Verrucomicrobiae bacterium]|jgi:hypothetical protein|nr:HEAT repeat domain-containing protein [Verrucomicrobiae bacterium]